MFVSANAKSPRSDRAESWRAYQAHLLAICWIVLSVGIFYVYSMLPSWLFHGGLGTFNVQTFLAWGFYAATGCTVWLLSFWFDPCLSERYELSLVTRMVFGGLLLACGMAVLSYLFYFCLFPYLMGRLAYFAGLYKVIYSASMIGMLAYGWLLFNHTKSNAMPQVDQLQEETDALGTNLHRSELALLDAQIEPHFLFNTLALVKRHYRHDPVVADEVMQALLHYLERAAPALRQEDWTLAQELDLVTSYLAILKHRFGDRLKYTMDCPAELTSVTMPALVLATLVENAVRHGLTPKSEGGTIRISVSQSDQTLSITIDDDGVGLRQTSGSGLGLSTVRARLRGAFGEDAGLVVEPRHPCGVRASLSLPASPLAVLSLIDQQKSHAK